MIQVMEHQHGTHQTLRPKRRQWAPTPHIRGAVDIAMPFETTNSRISYGTPNPGMIPQRLVGGVGGSVTFQMCGGIRETIGRPPPNCPSWAILAFRPILDTLFLKNREVSIGPAFPIVLFRK